jgi:hypothetical protein
MDAGSSFFCRWWTFARQLIDARRYVDERLKALLDELFSSIDADPANEEVISRHNKAKLIALLHEVEKHCGARAGFYVVLFAARLRVCKEIVRAVKDVL